jgi:hypothetical protein
MLLLQRDFLHEFPETRGAGLLAEDVLAGLQGGNRLRAVIAVRRHDEHGLDGAVVHGHPPVVQQRHVLQLQVLQHVARGGGIPVHHGGHLHVAALRRPPQQNRPHPPHSDHGRSHLFHG